jgi:hypothetical protein
LPIRRSPERGLCDKFEVPRAEIRTPAAETGQVKQGLFWNCSCCSILRVTILHGSPARSAQVGSGTRPL